MLSSKRPLALHKPSLQLTIRQVTVQDADLLQSCLWQDRPLRDVVDFLKRLQAYVDKLRGLGIVVVNPSEAELPIIAYGQIMKWVHCVEISDLLVHPSCRNRGIGTAMIQYLTGHVLSQGHECVELGVAESNPRALSLYRRLGFHDSYTLQLDLGQGNEPVIYLRLNLTKFQ